MSQLSICLGATAAIPAGKARWKYDRKYGPSGGWVLQGCNCPGRYCQPPSEKGLDDEERDVDCVNSPSPGPLGGGGSSDAD